jgi:hypothetical protein
MRAAAPRCCESCQETGCHEEYQRMDGTRDRSGRSKAAHQVGGDRVSDALSQVEAVGDDGM